ncbi:MAG: hypothetical protein U0441_25740 [Polyangiaceae bacterium]
MIAVAIVSPGCITVASPSLENAAKNLENTGKHVADGLKGLDPIGLNRLLNENKDLRQKNEDLEKTKLQLQTALDDKFGGRYRVCYRVKNPFACRTTLDATLSTLPPKTKSVYVLEKFDGQSGDACAQVPTAMTAEFDELRIHVNVHCTGTGTENFPDSVVFVEQSYDGVRWSTIHLNECNTRGKDCGEDTQNISFHTMMPKQAP